MMGVMGDGSLAHASALAFRIWAGRFGLLREESAHGRVDTRKMFQVHFREDPFIARCAEIFPARSVRTIQPYGVCVMS